MSKNIKRIVMPCELYSRCCGYYRPVDQWNKGKQSEFDDRKMQAVKDIKL